MHVTVGTGISCCLVRHGIPDPGVHGFAGLIGSTPLTIPSDAGGFRDTVTLERFSAGPALARQYAARTGRSVSGAEDVLALSDDGDAIAASEMVDEAATDARLVRGIAGNVLDPEAVVVGGGSGGSAGGRDPETMVSATRAHIWSEHLRALPIFRAYLGSDAAVIGAGLIALARRTGR